MNDIPPSPHVATPFGALDAFNRACFCISLDQEVLARALDSELGQPGLSAMVRQRCPFLFAALPVFVAAPQLERMKQVMLAVESVVALPAYREQALLRRLRLPAPEQADRWARSSATTFT